MNLEPSIFVGCHFESLAAGPDGDLHAGYVGSRVGNARERDAAFDQSIFRNYEAPQLSNR